MGYHVRQKITLVDRIENWNFLYGVAEMGIEKAISNLQEKNEKKEVFHAFGDPLVTSANEFRGVPTGGGSARFTVSYEYPLSTEEDKQVVYGIEDEGGKLNLNLAKAKVISNLFQVIADLDEEKAGEIAYSIVDWRDSDSSLSHPDHGAEDDYYEDLDPEYGAKDHDFQSLNELLLIRGMDQEIYDRIKPYVTIYGEIGVNINTAPKAVLLGLGCGETLAQKIVDYRSGTDRTFGTEDDIGFSDVTTVSAILGPAMSLSGPETNTLNLLVSGGLLTVNSTYFQVRSRGENWQKKETFEIIAVVDMEGKIYSWHSGVPRRMNAIEIKEAEDFEKDKENHS
jgi:hypothetical protein